MSWNIKKGEVGKAACSSSRRHEKLYDDIKLISLAKFGFHTTNNCVDSS